MFNYWFVGYAILNTDWIKEHGTQWRSGRIEVSSPEGGFPIEEIGITYDFEQMSKDMQEKNIKEHFEEWVDELESKKELSKKEILNLYYKQTGILLKTLN